jgi:hypothetical protein
MSTICTIIGSSFEIQLQRQFPEFKTSRAASTDCRAILPDFETPSFFVEAKAGNADYGFRLKKYQIDGFAKLDRSTSYVIGFHTTKGLLTFLEKRNRNWMIKYCLNHLQFDQMFFVSQLLTEKLWDKEMRVSKKSGVEYCVIKPRHFRNIIENTPFKRQEVTCLPEEYYGIDRRDFVLSSDKSTNASVILHKSYDRQMIQYLESKKML